MHIYFELFCAFFKTGLFSVGGGLATLPFLFEMTQQYAWISADLLPDMIAISESTPGSLGVNTATYVGWTAAGIPGSVVATTSLVFPSVVILTLIARSYDTFLEKKYVQDIFYALRPAVLGLISVVAWKLFCFSLLTDAYVQFSEKTFSAWYQLWEIGLFSVTNYTGYILSLFSCKSLILFFLLLILMKKLKAHPIYYIIGSGVVGILFNL